jgi:hypothetical protein
VSILIHLALWALIANKACMLTCHV